MNYSQKITFKSTIKVSLNVPALQTKEQLNQWISSEAARIHLIDHLKPSSFDKIRIIEAANNVDIIN